MAEHFEEEPYAKVIAPSKPAHDSFEYLAEVDCHDTDDGLMKSLVNQSAYVGKQLSTKAAVPANIHREKFRFLAQISQSR